MVSATEKSPPAGGHPLVEEKLQEPGEVAKLEKEEQEVETYLEKIEREPGKDPISDDSGQVVLTPSGSQAVTITLPLTEEEVKHGLHHKIVDAMYWLAKWCVRVTKKAAHMGVQVVYKKD